MSGELKLSEVAMRIAEKHTPHHDDECACWDYDEDDGEPLPCDCDRKPILFSCAMDIDTAIAAATDSERKRCAAIVRSTRTHDPEGARIVHNIETLILQPPTSKEPPNGST